VPWRSPGAVDWVKSEGAAKAGDGDGDHARWVERASKFLAGRWAAKEAVVKACSWRRLMFDEIMVLIERLGGRYMRVMRMYKESLPGRSSSSVSAMMASMRLRFVWQRTSRDSCENVLGRVRVGVRDRWEKLSLWRFSLLYCNTW
jgi:hypothetical protein